MAFDVRMRNPKCLTNIIMGEIIGFFYIGCCIIGKYSAQVNHNNDDVCRHICDLDLGPPAVFADMRLTT